MTNVEAKFIDSHPIIRKVSQNGFTFQQCEDPPFLELTVSREGRPAGYARFELSESKRKCLVENINVYVTRQGVATALCLLARAISDYGLIASSAKTEDGKAFWTAFEEKYLIAP